MAHTHPPLLRDIQVFDLILMAFDRSRQQIKRQTSCRDFMRHFATVTVVLYIVVQVNLNFIYKN